MTIFEASIGSVAEFLGALVALAGAFVSYSAVKTARDANRMSADVHNRAAAREAAADERERARDERESERDRRANAGVLDAWWVKTETSVTKDERWGIIVCNSSTGMVCRQVRIGVTGNSNSKMIEIPCLPPGRYFLESLPIGSQKRTLIPGWEDADPKVDLIDFRPLLNAQAKSVDGIEYTDNVGKRWRWTRE